MKSISDYLKWEKRQRVKNEKMYFKHIHIQYYTKELMDGTVEFWGYPVPQYIDNLDGKGNVRIKLKDPIYLGKYINDELTKPDDFYGLDRSTQRSALRLYEEVGVYGK